MHYYQSEGNLPSNSHIWATSIGSILTELCQKWKNTVIDILHTTYNPHFIDKEQKIYDAWSLFIIYWNTASITVNIPITKAKIALWTKYNARLQYEYFDIQDKERIQKDIIRIKELFDWSLLNHKKQIPDHERLIWKNKERISGKALGNFAEEDLIDTKSLFKLIQKNYQHNIEWRNGLHEDLTILIEAMQVEHQYNENQEPPKKDYIPNKYKLILERLSQFLENIKNHHFATLEALKKYQQSIKHWRRKQVYY